MDGVVILTGVVVLCLTWSAAFGCSCFPQHPQSQYCSSEFVFCGKVVKERLIKGPPDDFALNEMIRRYKVQILHKMKARYWGRINSYITIESAGNGAMCGMSLTVGQSYVIMGYKSGGKKTISSCGLVEIDSSLSFEQLFYLFTRGPYSYHKNCKSGCTNVDIDSKYCRLPENDYDAMDCLSLKSVCMKTKEACGWSNNEECRTTTIPTLMTARD